MPPFELFLLIPLAMVAFGVLFVVLSLRGRQEGPRFEAAALRAPGQVTDERRHVVDRSSGIDGSSSDSQWFPVVRFSLPDGREVEAETAWGTQLRVTRPGEQVTVLYQPEDPTRVAVEGQLG